MCENLSEVEMKRRLRNMLELFELADGKGLLNWVGDEETFDVVLHWHLWAQGKYNK